MTVLGANLITPGGGNVAANANVQLNDDITLCWGTDSDVCAVLNSAGLATNAELAGIIVGTSVHQEIIANSLIVSNITSSSGMMFLISSAAGNSQEFLSASADGTSTATLGWGMTVVQFAVGGVARLRYTAGAFAYQEATTISTSAGNLTLDPADDVVMGVGVLIERSTIAGITASTSQSQGNGLLTSEVNEIDAVGSTDDVVTLPAVLAGKKVVVLNNGANTLQIFPASGDNLGRGLNLSEQLEANEVVTYIGYDSTNWRKESSTEILHAEMHDQDNTDAFVINDAGADFHAYHSNGVAAGDLADWAFDAGGAGTSHAIASIADATGGKILVTTGDAHGLAVGDIISQTNLSDSAYVGLFIVLTVPLTTTYTVTAAFTATGTGTMDQAATLTCGVGAGGQYLLVWGASGTTVTNNETFDFEVCNNAVSVVGSKLRIEFGTGAKFSAFGMPSVLTVADGDKISFALSNEDTAGNITIRDITFTLVRL